MRTALILVLICSAGCHSALLPKREPRLSLYQTQYARWSLELQSAGGGRNRPVSPDIAPVVPSSTCTCPSVCARDAAFPCDCANPRCTNLNCRRSKPSRELLPEHPAIEAADMFTLWRENLPPTCVVVAVQARNSQCLEGAKRIVAPLVMKGWRVAYVDIDYSPELAAKLQVESVPTYIGFQDGDEVGRCTNPKPLEAAWDTINGWFTVIPVSAFGDTAKTIQIPATIVSVYDGDTVTVEVSLDAMLGFDARSQIPIRLRDCWAPEVRGAGIVAAEISRGIASRDHLRRYATAGDAATVDIPVDMTKPMKSVTLGRVLGYVKVGDRDLSRLQCETGHAVPNKPDLPAAQAAASTLRTY